MKDFKQAVEETKKRLGVDLFFICDRKPGWCNGWSGCQNELCHHTSDPDHARYKNNIKTFEPVELGDGKIGYFERDVLIDAPFTGCAINFSEVK